MLDAAATLFDFFFEANAADPQKAITRAQITGPRPALFIRLCVFTANLKMTRILIM
jgi:hypothetical protein